VVAAWEESSGTGGDVETVIGSEEREEETE